MGAYLSEPITKKISSDEANDELNCGASCMQGWRVDQEDAHNTILDYDTKAALFAVYDGHGGHEVSAYAADKLPNFIKTLESYKKGNFSQALIDAFLAFDASLVEDDVLEILNTLKLGDKEDGEEGSESEGEEVDNLCREASMPLEEVIARYEKNEKFQSPALRPKRTSDEGCSSSSSSCSTSNIKVDSLDLDQDTGKSSESKDTKSAESDVEVSKDKSSETKSEPSVNSKDTTDVKSDNNVDSEEMTDAKSDNSIDSKETTDTKSNSNVDSEETADAKSDVEAKNTKKLKTDDSAASDVKVNGNAEKDLKVENNELDHRLNGDITQSDSEATAKTNDTETSENSVEKVKENGEVSKSEFNGNSEESIKGKGKGKSIKGKGKAVISKSDVKQAVPEVNQEKKRQAAMKAAEIYRQIQKGKEWEEMSDEEDSDSDSETYEQNIGNTEGDDEDDNEESEEAEEEEDEDDDDDDDDDDTDDCDDEDEEDNNFTNDLLGMKEKPGFDSGCTACLALLQGTELYVANVGDSRAVVCRKDKALDMSIDHKPEDELEWQRIRKAGGRVTSDGRVNSGLNLSRALGDHGYKQNKSLPAEEQMISPLPDIKTLTLTEDDQFMIVACDGIWNSMSSQEACDFVLKRIEETKLSKICEEMFDSCLAPNILGDGTGCDNMTCIIVKFNDLRNLEVASSKRPAVSTSDDETPDQKKIKCSAE